MYLVLGLAAAAVAVVLLYNRSREDGQEVTDRWVGKAQQLAAVVLVLTQAVEGLIGALDRATGRPSYSRPAGFPGRLVDAFDDQEWR